RGGWGERAGGRSRATVLLCFDVEEFDAPLEYGISIPETEQAAVSATGLRLVLALLAELGIRATLFCTADFAERQAPLIQEAAALHEIASPGVRHAGLEPADLRRSRERLERLVGGAGRGVRGPPLAAGAPAAPPAAPPAAHAP